MSSKPPGRYIGPPGYVGPPAPSGRKPKRSRVIRIPDERDSDARRKAKRRAQTGDWGQDDVEVPLKATAAKIIPGIPQLRRIVGQLTILSADRTSRLVLSTIGQTKVNIVRSVGGESEMLRLGDLRGGWGYGQPADAIWGLAIGEYAVGKPNILVDATNGLRIRNFDADLIKLDLAGNADLSGKLLMRGATSAIAIGTTPPTSATQGTGIWIDRTGLYGLNVNVQQASINNTGQILAGAGGVTLDSNGITLLTDVAGVDSKSYKFKEAATGTITARISGYILATQIVMQVRVAPYTAKDSFLDIRAQTNFGGGKKAVIALVGNAGASDAGVQVTADDASGLGEVRIFRAPLVWQTDAAYDIGASGANRPRDLYLGGKITLAGQIVSSLATGTAPLSVASTTKVTNLNADLLDGLDSSAFVGINQRVGFSDVVTPPVTALGNIMLASVDRTITFVSFYIALYVATTNDASNYWTVGLIRLSDGLGIASVNTSGVGANAWNLLFTTAFNIASVGTADLGLYLRATPTGAPGGLTWAHPMLSVSG